jgi:alanine-synthesizing transaminase
MFSSRTNWNLEENRLTRLVREHKARGEALLDLTDTNPTRCGFQAPPWLLDSLRNPENLVYEPDPKGLAETRKALANYYREIGVQIDPDCLVLTASTSEAYSFLFRLLCDPEDELVVPRPGYPLFDILAPLGDVRLVPYDLRYDGEWHVDLESLRAGLTDRTKAIVIVSPSNPTGSFLKTQEWDEIERLASQRQCAVIADEVFSPFPFKPDPTSITSLAGSAKVLTFTLGGLSKLAGLPQMKLAWITVSGPPLQRTAAIGRLEVISDSLLSVATPIQHATPRILREHRAITAPILKRVSRNYSWLTSAISPSSGISLLTSEGGWSAILRVPATRTDEDWAVAFLQEKGVLVHPGHFYDCAAGTCLIVSLLPLPDVLQKGIHKILRFMGSE